MKKNVAIIIGNESPCNVPDTRTTITVAHNKQAQRIHFLFVSFPE